MKIMGYFKRPVALPSDIWREVKDEEAAAATITVFCKPSPKPCLEISLSCATDS